MSASISLSNKFHHEEREGARREEGVGKNVIITRKENISFVLLRELRGLISLVSDVIQQSLNDISIRDTISSHSLLIKRILTIQ
jgi:hypothetical protein